MQKLNCKINDLIFNYSLSLDKLLTKISDYSKLKESFNDNQDHINLIAQEFFKLDCDGFRKGVKNKPADNQRA